MNAETTRTVFPFLIVALAGMTISAGNAADPAPMSDSQIERMHQRNRSAAEKAWAIDQKKFSRDDFRQMEIA